MITEDTLIEFLVLQKQLKTITARIDAIKAEIKDIGSFCTDRYTAAVYEQERTGIAGLQEVAHVFGFEILNKYELIRNSKFLVVKVAPILQKQSIDL